MDFLTAEHHYRWYNEQFQQGKITADQYKLAIEQLRVTDEYGRLWMIQQGSGQWFVFYNNQWMPSTPEIQRQPSPLQQPAEKKKKKAGWVLPAILGISMLCVIAVIIGGLLLVKKNGSLTFINKLIPAGSTSTTLAEFKTVETIPVSAGSDSPIGSSGSMLSIPVESLPPDIQVSAIVSVPGKDLTNLIEEAFQTDSNFYQIIADGENDGTGSALFTVPAEKKIALLMEVFDDKYLAFTEIPIQNGEISVNIPIGSAETDSADESLSMNGNMRFSIIQFDPPTSSLETGHFASPIQAADPLSCGIDIKVESYSYQSVTHTVDSFCRKNLSGTIRVMVYPKETPNITKEKIDPLVDIVESIMSTYQQKGFTAAVLKDAWQKRVSIIVESGSGDPYYSSANGLVHIPEDSLGSGYGKNLNYELAHELAHWVQDEAYNFTSSYWANLSGLSSESKWWFETSAENMVFLYDTNAIERNLTTYGMTTPSTGNTPFQFSPNQWNDQLYLHAQLVKVFMCENEYACPVSEAGFVKAINEGTFPFEGDAISNIEKNMESYASYLIGDMVLSANSNIPKSNAIKTGSGYGEFITTKDDGKGGYSFSKTGYEPQMKEVSSEMGKKLEIKALMEKGSVYPVTINSPSGSNFGMPLEVKISAGAPFLYQLGDDRVIYTDGTKEITLGPIHSVIGKQKLRIVAYAMNEPATFKATVQPLDLSGDWIVYSTGASGGDIQCDDDSEGDSSETNYSETAMFTSVYTSLPAAVTGVFTPDNGQTGYTWTMSPGADMTFGEDVALEINGSALIAKEGIRLQTKLTIPRKETNLTNSLPMLSGFGLISLITLFSLHKKTRLVYTLMIIAGLILMTGCAGGFGGMYGTLAADTTFTQLEAGGDRTAQSIVQSLPGFSADDDSGPAAWTNVKPKYVLTGTAVGTIDIKIITWSSDMVNGEVEQISTCSGTVNYGVIGMLFEDGNITSME